MFLLLLLFLVAGLLNTYKSLFSLDDSLAGIKTRDDLFDYLSFVSGQTQLIQPGTNLVLACSY